jgi:hypothetical protein
MHVENRALDFFDVVQPPRPSAVVQANDAAHNLGHALQEQEQTTQRDE